MDPEKRRKFFFCQIAVGVKRLIDLAVLIPGEKTPAMGRFPIRVERTARIAPRTAVETHEDWQSHFVGYTHVGFVEFDFSCINHIARRPVAGHIFGVVIVEGDAYRTVARMNTKMIDKLLKLSANSVIPMCSPGEAGGKDEKGDRPRTTLLKSLRLWE